RLLAGPFTKAGTFTRYDFAGVQSAFDWVFITNDKIVYQLQGKEPSDQDVFGWKRVDVSPKIDENSWNMIYIGDFDNDGDSRFDWVLYLNRQDTDQIYKLAGVSRQGTFEYEKIDDLVVHMDGSEVTFASSDAVQWSAGQRLEKLKVISPQDLRGITLKTNLVHHYEGITQQITIEFYCDGSFHYHDELLTGQYDQIIDIRGSKIVIEFGSIYLYGIDQEGQPAEEYAYTISGDGYLYAGRSCYSMDYPDEKGQSCPYGAYLETILVREVCR
ncbi:MAG: hypothetical protein GXO16_03900, partial [Epsilonproteobacteria bacterium]|nr:hypothetical protein [Campylobacterota bacterium]